MTNPSEHRAGHHSSTAPAASGTECPTRQDLLARLTQAFDDFSAAVRESRAGSSVVGNRTEAPGARCAEVWTELREHQEKHGCWRQRENSK